MHYCACRLRQWQIALEASRRCRQSTGIPLTRHHCHLQKSSFNDPDLTTPNRKILVLLEQLLLQLKSFSTVTPCAATVWKHDGQNVFDDTLHCRCSLPGLLAIASLGFDLERTSSVACPVS